MNPRNTIYIVKSRRVCMEYKKLYYSRFRRIKQDGEWVGNSGDELFTGKFEDCVKLIRKLKSNEHPKTKVWREYEIQVFSNPE